MLLSLSIQLQQDPLKRESDAKISLGIRKENNIHYCIRNKLYCIVPEQMFYQKKKKKKNRKKNDFNWQISLEELEISVDLLT